MGHYEHHHSELIIIMTDGRCMNTIMLIIILILMMDNEFIIMNTIILIIIRIGSQVSSTVPLSPPGCGRNCSFLGLHFTETSLTLCQDGGLYFLATSAGEKEGPRHALSCSIGFGTVHLARRKPRYFLVHITVAQHLCKWRNCFASGQ